MSTPSPPREPMKRWVVALLWTLAVIIIIVGVCAVILTGAMG